MLSIFDYQSRNPVKGRVAQSSNRKAPLSRSSSLMSLLVSVLAYRTCLFLQLILTGQPTKLRTMRI